MKKINVLLLVCIFAAMLVSAVSAADIYMFIPSPEYADAINALIEEYKTVAPDVNINYETTQSDYPTLLKAKINAGSTPDIFGSTSGKEIAVYLDYSYNFADQPAAEAMTDAVKGVMMSGDEVHGFAIKGNYFGMLYNKDIFEEVGITEFPKTLEGLKEAAEKISAAGYQVFSDGFGEWWVFKHAWQTFFDAASDDPAALADAFIKGEAHWADYPVLYNNWFDFVDLVVKYGDAKPLESFLANEVADFAVGKSAIVVGQGAWVEADMLAINPDLHLGFVGYPVDDDPDHARVIGGSDQALRINKDSAVLQDVLDFVNWWYTSDYGKDWFNNVAGVIPPVKGAVSPDMEVIKQGDALAESDGVAALSITYFTDASHQAFGEIMQSYIAGTIDKDTACKQIEETWVKLEN